MTRIKNYMGKGDLLQQERSLETSSPAYTLSSQPTKYLLWFLVRPPPCCRADQGWLLVMDSNLLHTESMRAAWRGNDSRLLSQEQYDNNDWDNSEVNKTDGRSLYCWFVKSSGVSLSQRVRAALCIIAILHSLQSTAPLHHWKILISNNQISLKHQTKNPPDHQCIS